MAAILAVKQRNGEFSRVTFEGERLIVGEGLTFTPDFAIWLNDGRKKYIEVKGKKIWEDALVKFKGAKHLYPLAIWELHQLIGNQWTQLL